MRPVRSARAVVVTSLTLAALALAGCAGGDKDPSGPGAVGLGTASVSVTGAVTRTLTAQAAFGSNVLGMDRFGLVLEEEDGTIGLGVVKNSTGRPAPGTYPLGDTESAQYGELVVSPSGGTTQFFISETGTLTITASSASSLQGTISFRGRNEFGSGTVEVTATFNAICFPTAAASCD